MTLQIKKASVTECTSDILNKLLWKVYLRFTCDASPSLQATRIDNIVASVAVNQPNPLHIALGVLMSEHKSEIDILFNFSIICSYVELRCFLRSTAVQAARDTAVAGLSEFIHKIVG